MAFCKEINTEPMLGVNMGTGTIQDASRISLNTVMVRLVANTPIFALNTALLILTE
ncbi:MAG UNVERIFIED_CONTAM: hypothetical protein LVT10_10380 [Anaerolineae bacterium]|jgi:hypothetical protein